MCVGRQGRWNGKRGEGMRARGWLPVGGIALSLMVAVQTPAQASPTIVGLWHMDETSGTTAVDSSGDGNNGALTAISFVSPGFDGTGGAYSFNGTSSKVLIPNSVSLNPGTANITVVVHVKFTVAPPGAGDYDLMRKGKSNYYKIEIATGGKARCQFHGTSNGKGLVFGPNLADGLWHTIACTKTATGISGNVDGIYTASKAVTIGSISNTVALSLGGKAEGNEDLYNGVMDEVSITVG
jgi:hypothetical protein